ncbi:MAG TPA: hypothetical protein VF363_03555 [Candidatus Eisenbacteria bacterium]
MRITKTGLAGALLLASIIGALALAAGHAVAAPPATGTKTIVGEVVDPACWIINGAHGETHKECAIACAKAGQTLAILEKKTNRLYILASEKPGEDPNKGVLDFVAQNVAVTGKVYTRNGAWGIQVTSIQPAGRDAK